MCDKEFIGNNPGCVGGGGGIVALHAPTHTDGSDDIQSATFTQKGVMTIDQALETHAYDGMAFDKPALTVVDATGLKLDIEKLGGGDMRFVIDGVISTGCVSFLWAVHSRK